MQSFKTYVLENSKVSCELNVSMIIIRLCLRGDQFRRNGVVMMEEAKLWLQGY